jgi:LysM repeat protein
MNKKRALHLTGILLVGVMLASACTQTYSQTPLGTPTLIPTGLFVSPFPSGQDPLQIIAELGTQTAAAGTVQAGGTVEVTGTPGTPVTQSSETTVAGTPSTETVEATEPTTSGATLLPVTVIPGGSTFTPTTQAGGATLVSGTSIVIATSTPGAVGSVPSTYTLQKGEWPYCIARRFDVNPNELLTLNQLTAAESVALNPGLVLSLPQSGNNFPPPRSWHSHPDTYTVDPGDTIGSVACYYGDVTPAQIATANNLSTSSTLTTRQKLTIP